MNSNPIWNREIVTTWHGEAQMVERINMVKDKRQSLYTQKNNRFFDVIGYRANPAS